MDNLEKVVEQKSVNKRLKELLISGNIPNGKENISYTYIFELLSLIFTYCNAGMGYIIDNGLIYSKEIKDFKRVTLNDLKEGLECLYE